MNVIDHLLKQGAFEAEELVVKGEGAFYTTAADPAPGSRATAADRIVLVPEPFKPWLGVVVRNNKTKCIVLGPGDSWTLTLEPP